MARVRTAAGAEQYDQPVGSVIVLDVIPDAGTFLNESQRYRPTLGRETRAALGVLGEALSDYMGDADPSEPERQTRRQVADLLQGHDLPDAERERAEAVLAALRAAPAIGGTLFRGFAVAEGAEAFAARYAPGEVKDLNLTSFSKDMRAAQKFQLRNETKNRTKVMVILSGKHRGLPLRNLSHDREYFDERETLTAGRFKVKSATAHVDETDYGTIEGVTIVLTQVEVP